MQNLSPSDSQTRSKNTPSPHAPVDVGSDGTEIDDTVVVGGSNGGDSVNSSRSRKKSRLSPAVGTPTSLPIQPSNTASASVASSASTRSLRNNRSVGVEAASTETVTSSRSSLRNQQKSPSIQFSGCVASSSSSSGAMDVEPTSEPSEHASARRFHGTTTTSSSSSSTRGNDDGDGDGGGAMDVDVDVSDRWGMDGHGMEGNWGQEVGDGRLASGDGNGGLNHEGYYQEGDQEGGQEGGEEGDQEMAEDELVTAERECEDVDDAGADAGEGYDGMYDENIFDDGVYDEGYFGGYGEGHGGEGDDGGDGGGGGVDNGEGDGDDEYNLSAYPYGSIEDDPGNLLVERCQALLWRQLHEYNNLGHLAEEENQLKMRLKSAFDRRVSTSILVVGIIDTPSQLISIHHPQPLN